MYTILVVDDAKHILQSLEQDLSEAGYQVLTADCGETAMIQLEMFSVDMILLDIYMSGMTGLEVLQKIKKQEKMHHVPIIMLSSADDEDQFVAALEYGADDFLAKPYITKVLLARIRNSFRLMEKTQELEKLAKTDFLTGVNNRGNFEKLVYGVINQSRRMDQAIVLVIFDLDHFKRINDSYGHSVGDKVLIEFCKLLLVCFREYDIVGRVGGEEFGVCLPNTDINDAIYACERMRTKLFFKRFELEGEITKDIRISASAGLASAKGKDINYENLFKKADNALYQAKKSGRNKIIHNGANSGINEVAYSEDHIAENLKRPFPASNKIGSEVIKRMLDNSNNVLDKSMHDKTNKFPGLNYKIGIENVLGDKVLFSEVLLMFIEEHGNDDKKLNKFIKERDYEALKSLLHTLKGVACSIGATGLFNASRELEGVMNDNLTEQYDEKLVAVTEALIEIVNGVKAQLKLN